MVPALGPQHRLAQATLLLRPIVVNSQDRRSYPAARASFCDITKSTALLITTARPERGKMHLRSSASVKYS
jgi:hypothetical protein